jgi:peptidoglycan/LPS O-acetylase OafA/YrhL
VVNSIRRGSRPRSNGLDFVRATAIVWVMIYHAMIFDLVPDPDHWFVAFGWMGVDLFFVLSGFLISGQLIAPFADGSTPDYRKFFARRLLRTLPAYFAVVGIYAFIPAAWERQAMQPLWQFLTFTENLLYVADAPKAFSHVWSLCVEEQFYLLLPAVAALVALRPSAGKVRALLCFFLVAGMVVRARLWLDQVALPHFDSGGAPQGARYMELIYYPTWSRLDGLLAGVALAVLQTFRPKRWTAFTSSPNLLLAAGLAGLGGSMVFFQDQIAALAPAVFGYPLLSCSIALIVAAASSDQCIISIRKVPGVQALATGAYSLYLIHKMAYGAVIKLAASTELGGYWLLAAALLAALLAGTALYWAVERPFLKLRDRLEGPSRSSISKDDLPIDPGRDGSVPVEA